MKDKLQRIKLEQIPLFQGLQPDELAQIRSQLHEATYREGTNIIGAQQPGDVVYVIVRGTVKVHVKRSGGPDVVLGILGAGEVLGEMSAADSLVRSANVTAKEDTLVLWMDRRWFHDRLRSMPRFALNLVRILSRRLRLANAQVQSLAVLDVDGRVARQLLALAQEYSQGGELRGTVIPVRISQTELGQMVGASRVRVNQVLSFYRDQGYISIDEENRITVRDPAGLARRFQ
jgi:CRP/FNR family cyclic AMP-dependent transcriptional regulator